MQDLLLRSIHLPIILTTLIENKEQQLYEQGASQESIAKYVKHWLVWVRSGVEIDLTTVIKHGLASQLGQALTRKYRVDTLYFR